MPPPQTLRPMWAYDVPHIEHPPTYESVRLPRLDSAPGLLRCSPGLPGPPQGGDRAEYVMSAAGPWQRGWEEDWDGRHPVVCPSPLDNPPSRWLCLLPFLHIWKFAPRPNGLSGFHTPLFNLGRKRYLFCAFSSPFKVSFQSICCRVKSFQVSCETMSCQGHDIVSAQHTKNCCY